MSTYIVKPITYAQNISLIILFFLLFVLAICPVMGQEGPNKMRVEPLNYSMWHTLRFPQISGNGKWYSYWRPYEQEQDTLFVNSVSGKERYVLPNAHYNQFEPTVNPKILAFINKKKGVGVLHLKTGNIEWINKATRFEFSRNGKYLACFSPKNKNGYLRLLDVEKNETLIIEGVQQFSFDPTGNNAVLIINEVNKIKIELLDLSSLKRSLILSNAHSDFLYPTWNANGSGLAFIESTINLKQRLYYFEGGKSPVLKKMDDVGLKLERLEISKLELSFSEDGERLFFWTHRKEKLLNVLDADSVKVQIWKSTDKWIYPRRKLDWEYQKNDKLAVWWPKTQRFFQIGTMEQPEVILTKDQKFAISYNILTYEPQNRQFPQSDFYITNLESKESKLLSEKMETLLDYISLSPNGENIAYFKENNWFNYNILKNEHTNVTKNIPFPLYHKHAEHSLYVIPFGIDWTDDNNLMIYDEFDIWKTSINGDRLQRLTEGRKNKISYRGYKNLFDGFYSFGIQENFLGFNLSENIVFATRDSLFNYGYALRKPNGRIISLLSESGRHSELRKAKFTNSYIYLKEKNNDPPSLNILTGGKSKLLVRSNSHQDKFKMGKTELIAYKNKEGEQLHGLLHYPDNYVVGKQYPMIVHIYELQSNRFQVYEKPSLFNSEGFNYRNFTAKDYFVLEPDILIQEGKPGTSAMDCVTTAVNKVLEKRIVKRNAIGLMGHSFGGYETAFIISQTNLFSAAVVGAGVFDVVSSYHTINEESGRPEHWRFENHQWRFGKSFYDIKDAYKKNSPLEFVQNIKTPTLIWTGNKDYQVNWHQSEGMYLALRRLKIESELLIYENEKHSLTQPQNQKDLTERIIKWFEKYLIKN
ncbi:MAG: prolyl oligopeptidase family serine peptidase [Aequorivita sp.]